MVVNIMLNLKAEYTEFVFQGVFLCFLIKLLFYRTQQYILSLNKNIYKASSSPHSDVRYITPYRSLKVNYCG